MKTKIMIAFALVMIAAFTGYNVCKVQRTVLISDIALANVEALASVGEADSNTAYGVGVNLAVSFSCIVGCPICKIYLVDHGYRKFKEKIHFMEQYR